MEMVLVKKRYEILDGLRGVAALIVLLYHHLDLYGLANRCTHGYLAVDFFFILSGYVIGYAYDDRWGRMDTWTFFKRRLIRLHPMILMATLIGVSFFYFGSGDLFPLIADCPAWKLIGAALLGILMIPMPVAWDIRGWNEFCPVNGNAWTLYFEYAANILYALVIRHFGKAVLVVFVAVSAFLTLNLALGWDVLGMIGPRAEQTYTVIGGWELSTVHVTIGFSRLLYPFFAGLLLSRLGMVIRLKGGFWWCSLVLSAILFTPPLAGIANGFFEAGCILLLFPVLVLAGAGSEVTGRSAGLCRWLGEISYPLYIVQYPVVYTLLGGWVKAHPNVPAGQSLVVNTGCFALSVFLAWASLELYDKPVRRWLSERRR